ncbi:hypothetical protein GCM10010293_62430 [Streptomyces griseoflavus]|nr:hypothetical protein GCM10010293_62430 [Streptomyces griseoflavus]
MVSARGRPDRVDSGDARSGAWAGVFPSCRFIDRGLLAELSAKPDGMPHHPGQVAEVCQREGRPGLTWLTAGGRWLFVTSGVRGRLVSSCNLWEQFTLTGSKPST